MGEGAFSHPVPSLHLAQETAGGWDSAMTCLTRKSQPLCNHVVPWGQRLPKKEQHTAAQVQLSAYPVYLPRMLFLKTD